MDCSPSGSSVHGILQPKTQEWVAIPFSGDLPDPGIEPSSPALRADSLPSAPPGKPQEGGDICIHIADSFHCTAETNTIL